MVFSVIMAMLKIMKLEREEISVRRNTIAPEERLSSLKFVKSMASRIPSLIEKPPSVVNARSAILALEISVEAEASMTSVKSSLANSGMIYTDFHNRNFIVHLSCFDSGYNANQPISI